MYNGSKNYRSNNNFSVSKSGLRVGKFFIKQEYLILGSGLLIFLFVLHAVTKIVNTSLLIHFGCFAGALLLLANLREVLGNSFSPRQNTALLNSLVGGALVGAWLSQVIGLLFWIPAVILLGIATPLAFGSAPAYKVYLQQAQKSAIRVVQSVEQALNKQS